MKKGIVLSLCFSVFMLLCAVPVQAWQGRMAGMGDVYGLVEDESDFLTHPAGIANGKGLNFYGSMMFGVQTTDKLKYSTFTYDAGDPSDWWSLDHEAAGREFRYEGLFGGAFPLGKGRMGVFFQYTGFSDSLRGDQIDNEAGGSVVTNSYDFRNRLDALSLRVLYGIPVSSNLKVGAELQIGQKKEEIKNHIEYPGQYRINDLWSGDLFHLGIPYDSKYYVASLKASAETTMGPAKAAFTMRGGLPFSSRNHYRHKISYSGVLSNYGDMSGKVKGYNVGADTWVRLPLNRSLSFPFLVGFDYELLKRRGDGYLINPNIFATDHEQRKKTLTITAGGGVDYMPAQGTKIAGGLYYNYLRNNSRFSWNAQYQADLTVPQERYDWNPVPKTTEHRISLKGAVEKVIISDISLVTGFNAYYGRVKQENEYSEVWYNTESNSASMKGKRWGAGASLGASIKAGATIVEPYIAGSFERLNLSGDGAYYYNGTLGAIASDVSLKKKTWFIGGGLSMRF